MIIKPRIRGFICTTAHPTGCAANIAEQMRVMQAQGAIEGGTKKALVVGASGGYGLACRVAAAFGCGADTLGVSFEKTPTEKKTGTAGWYNNIAFEEAAHAAGLYAKTLDGDAYSDEMKATVYDTIREDMGQIDLLIYSLASPVRQHPKTGKLYRNAIKPLGDTLRIKGLHIDRGEVQEVELEPGTEEDIEGTVAVMGGEDWEYWVDGLKAQGLLAPGFKTVAFTYIGSELTWPIYWHGTLGRAKEDLDRAARDLTKRLTDLDGNAHVACLKAVVTQASTAIPVVPLYMSLLFKVMKEQNVHEDVPHHIDRFFRTQLYGPGPLRLDEADRIRMDDVEMSDPIQSEMNRRWPVVSTENIGELGDMDGFRADFLRIFGFGFDGVDYDADLDPTLGRI